MTFGVLAAVAASSSENDVAPGVLGFLVVAAMGVALVFLLRSMNKQFRKITPDPEPAAVRPRTRRPGRKHPSRRRRVGVSRRVPAGPLLACWVAA